MWRGCLALLVLCGCFHAAVSAQEACPWLTEGTAAAMLGGAVTATVHASALEGSCEFVRQPSPAQHATVDTTLSLKIAVGHQPPNECLQGERAIGIGEDTTMCAADIAGERRETLRGRVRTTWFLIVLTAHGASGHDTTALRRVLQEIGEEVSGNLF